MAYFNTVSRFRNADFIFCIVHICIRTKNQKNVDEISTLRAFVVACELLSLRVAMQRLSYNTKNEFI